MSFVNNQGDRFWGLDGRLAVSPAEAARALGLSPSSLRRLEKNGSLVPFRANRRVLYSVKALEAWIAAASRFVGKERGLTA